MLFIDADASVVSRSGIKNMFVSDLSAVRFNINLVWRDGMYFIVNFWIVKLLTIPRTLENDRIKL